jgi:hypothetical protein
MGTGPQEAGVAAVITRRTAYGLGGALALLCAATLMLGADRVDAQGQSSQVDVLEAPVMGGGPAQVGRTLTGSHAVWVGPRGTKARWEWWSCPQNPESPSDCIRRKLSDAQYDSQYTIPSADKDRYIWLVLYAWCCRDKNPQQEDSEVTGPSARVVAAPTPTPTPAPTPSATATPTPTVTPVPPAATPTPTPEPVFDTAAPAATPVPTNGQVLHESASSRKVIRPFPVVRMRGRLTANGARVTVLSVRAPRKAKVTVRCKGSCPTRRWSKNASARKSRLTRIGAFERSLRSGTVITVTVTRHDYIGKRTVFVIRRGQAPLRTDRCLNPRGRVTRCPSGV